MNINHETPKDTQVSTRNASNPIKRASLMPQDLEQNIEVQTVDRHFELQYLICSGVLPGILPAIKCHLKEVVIHQWKTYSSFKTKTGLSKMTKSTEADSKPFSHQVNHPRNECFFSFWEFFYRSLTGVLWNKMPTYNYFIKQRVGLVLGWKSVDD